MDWVNNHKILKYENNNINFWENNSEKQNRKIPKFIQNDNKKVLVTLRFV